MCVSKLCDDKLRTRCVSRVVCDVDDVEEEGGGRSRRAGEGGSAEPKTRTPHKDVGKKRKREKEKRTGESVAAG